MATIVNNPGNSDSGATAGLVVALFVIVAVALIAFFIWPGLGNSGGGDADTTINVEVPALDSGSAGAGATQ